MSGYKMAEIRDNETGHIVSVMNIGFGLLQRILDGEVDVLKIYEVEVTKYPSMFEIVLLQCHDDGEVLPEKLQSYLSSALEKREKIRERRERQEKESQIHTLWHRKLKELGKEVS